MNGAATHWARMAEAGAVAGMRLLYGVYRLFGRWPFRIVLVPVMIYFFLVRGVARRASLEYLARLNPATAPGVAPPPASLQSPAAGHWRRTWLSFRHFLAFGESLLDKALVWTGWLPAGLELRGWDALAETVRATGRGVLLLVSHLGNIELARAIGKRQHGVKIVALVHTHHAVNFNRFLASLNPDSQVELLQVTAVDSATAIELADRIERGYLVAIAADRVPVSEGGRVVFAPFFGEPAPFPVGPRVLAGALKVPVWLMFCLNTPGGYLLAFERFSDASPLPHKDRDSALRQYATHYAARLEHYCRLAPLQWFNFYSFWPAAPDGDGVSAPQ